MKPGGPRHRPPNVADVSKTASLAIFFGHDAPHAAGCRARVRSPSAARPRQPRRGRRGADRPHRPQRHGQVVAAASDRGTTRARRRRAPDRATASGSCWSSRNPSCRARRRCASASPFAASSKRFPTSASAGAPRRGSSNTCIASAWTRRPRPTPRRAARRSAPRWRWRLPWRRTSCFSTSRPIISTSTASRCVEELVAKAPAAIVITHDRAFLDRVATRIVELDRGLLRSYPGNFTAYESRKAGELAAEAIAKRKFDQFWAQEEAWIRKGVEARRTRDEGRVRRLEALRRERSERRARLGNVKLAIDAGERSGRLVAELIARQQGVRRTHAGARSHAAHHARRPAGPDRSQRRGQVDALEADPRHAAAGLGHRQARHEAARSPTSTSCASSSTANARSPKPSARAPNGWRPPAGASTSSPISATSCFAPQRADTPVRALSGGERNRLLLARLFARPANLLVLDEPTNDLDIESLELLESTLQTYPGTLLLVSHDRTFLDNVVTQTLVAESRDGIERNVARVRRRLQRLGGAAATAGAAGGDRSRKVDAWAGQVGEPPRGVARRWVARRGADQALVRRAAGARGAAGRDRGAGTRAARAHRADVPRRLSPRGGAADEGGPGAGRGNRARARPEVRALGRARRAGRREARA